MHPACSANLKVCFCEIPPGVTGQVNRIITSPASAESRFKSETEPSQGNNNFNTESTPQTVNYLSSFYSTCILETYLAFAEWSVALIVGLVFSATALVIYGLKQRLNFGMAEFKFLISKSKSGNIGLKHRLQICM